MSQLCLLESRPSRKPEKPIALKELIEDPRHCCKARTTPIGLFGCRVFLLSNQARNLEETNSTDSHNIEVSFRNSLLRLQSKLIKEMSHEPNSAQRELEVNAESFCGEGRPVTGAQPTGARMQGLGPGTGALHRKSPSCVRSECACRRRCFVASDGASGGPFTLLYITFAIAILHSFFS